MNVNVLTAASGTETAKPVWNITEKQNHVLIAEKTEMKKDAVKKNNFIRKIPVPVIW